MSIRLDEASALSVGPKAERSGYCNENGNVKTQVGAFVCASRGMVM